MMDNTKAMWDILVANKLRHLCSSANKRNKEFNITFREVEKLMKRKTCAYTGIKLTEPNKDGETLLWTDRTFERVDPSVGYVSGNVVVICRQANLLKEGLLESKSQKLPHKPNPLAVDLDFLVKFTKGVVDMGYTEN